MKTPLTIDELRTRDRRAYDAFMDFTEAQTMFWQLFVSSTGNFWAEDWQSGGTARWLSAIGQWR